MTTSTTPPARAGRSSFLSFADDAVLVLVFVVIGRASHDESESLLVGTLTTLWPFLAGLVIGWLVTRAWRAPLAIVRTGIPVVISTVVFGMLFRVLSDQGVQPAFVIVTTIALAILLLGWRLIVARLLRRRAR